jgi:nitric oxide reductase subunit B
LVAIITFAILAWATTATYRLAPPQPDRFVGADGTVVMTGDDIHAGKGGFQKADLMDYGSLYGMGSYYGEDYTASTLIRLGTAIRENIARATDGKPFASLGADQQAAVAAAMQRDLQGIDLTQLKITLSPPLAAAATRKTQAQTRRRSAGDFERKPLDGPLGRRLADAAQGLSAVADGLS